MDDNTLCRSAFRLAVTAISKRTELESYGLSPSLLNALNSSAIKFNMAIDEHFDAITYRDLGSEERIAFGNILYASILNPSNSCKTIFMDVNKAKYNNYLVKHKSNFKNL